MLLLLVDNLFKYDSWFIFVLPPAVKFKEHTPWLACCWREFFAGNYPLLTELFGFQNFTIWKIIKGKLGILLTKQAGTQNVKPPLLLVILVDESELLPLPLGLSNL